MGPGSEPSYLTAFVMEKIVMAFGAFEMALFMVALTALMREFKATFMFEVMMTLGTVVEMAILIGTGQ